MNIVLIGFMGTGKSEVGRRLAQRLKMSFVDLDQLIERDAQMTVARIFELEGEAGFRKRESQAVERLSAPDNHVISTGGGVVLDPENLRRLKALGSLVCLTARPEVIQKRTGENAADRPMLKGASSLEQIKMLLKARAPFYARADTTVDTSDRSAQEVVTAIVEQMGGLAVRSKGAA